jgi:type I restriction enzyme S subunit
VEQELIVRQLSILDTKIEFHHTKKQTLTDLFKTQLHELMTGQRRVHELEFEEEITGV